MMLSYIGEFGFLNGGLLAISRLLGKISGGRARLHKYVFVAQPVAEKRWLPAQRGADVEIRQLMPGDPVIAQFPRPASVIPYRFRQGAVCLAALKEGRCIGFLWLALGPYQEDEVRCSYVPSPAGKACWDFDVYIDPAHRTGIVFLKLWDEANRFLTERGIGWSLSRISAFNTASMSSHARMGATRVGSALFISLGALQICAATVAPYLAFSTGPDTYPVFALRPPHG
jgi:hypothetical protein